MKPYDSVQVVRTWCRFRTDLVLRCLVNPEGLNCGDLLLDVIPELTIRLTV
jgi:hypothetical protein